MKFNIGYITFVSLKTVNLMMVFFNLLIIFVCLLTVFDGSRQLLMVISVSNKIYCFEYIYCQILKCFLSIQFSGE